MSVCVCVTDVKCTDSLHQGSFSIRSLVYTSGSQPKSKVFRSGAPVCKGKAGTCYPPLLREYSGTRHRLNNLFQECCVTGGNTAVWDNTLGLLTTVTFFTAYSFHFFFFVHFHLALC